jgi:hypothetical protein
VAGTLIIFLLLFWFKLRIVGFEPKGEDDAQAAPVPRVWPISFLFLFDRLIPLYRIREQHYAIAKFYRRATDKEVKAAPREPGGPPYAMSYFGRKISVWAADDADKRRAEKILVVLRILGAFFTVYLLAAIKELLPS